MEVKERRSTKVAPATEAVSAWPSSSSWTRACVLAETVGMSAAAAAAVLVRHLGGSTRDHWLALALAVAGGLVEGVALGWFQARSLRAVLGDRRQAWLWSTVVVAGVGWALASAPSTVQGVGAESSSPPWWLVALGAAGLGLVMGALLGAAQAQAVRPRVSHASRWIGVSALAWAPAMVLIFTGATLPSESWPDSAVLLSGPLTGAVAGFALGRTSGWLLPSLAGAKPHDLLVLRLLAGAGHHRMGSRLLGLRMHGVLTGRTIELPVGYASCGPVLVVVPGHADRKHWWHNLEHGTTEVDVLVQGSWRSAAAEVLRPGAPSYDSARNAYARRWPKVALPEGQPLVLLYGLTRN